MRWGGRLDVQEHTRKMRAAAVWYEVVGRSETAEAPTGRITPYYGAVASSACMMERCGRGFRRFLVVWTHPSCEEGRLHSSYRVGGGRRSSVGLPVTLRRNSTKFGHRSRVDLGSISVRSRISGRFRVDLSRILGQSRFDLGQPSPRSKLSVAPLTYQ